MDNWFQEKQQRLLTEPLYSSWASLGQTRSFLAASDVGLFHHLSEQAVVPDVMVSLDVTVPQEWWEHHNRSYMIWEMGKAPEIVIEIVSNKRGGEEDKFRRYALAGVPYYAIYDPLLKLGRRPLRVYALHAGRYVEVMESSYLEELGLGLTLWKDTFEGLSATWLRWCDKDGKLIESGAEKAEREHERAEQERERAEQERERADRLAARLRELGIDPEAL